MNRKKILIFSLAYYPKYVGGAEVAIKEITDRVSAGRYEFHMITNRYDASLSKVEQIGNVLVHRIGPTVSDADISTTHHPLFYFAKILYVPLAAMKARTLHRQHGYSGFWAMMVYMTFPVAILRLSGLKLPYAVTLQEGDPYDWVFERWYIKLFRPLLLSGIRNATVAQTISRFLAKWVQNAGFKGPIFVIPNGADFSNFSRQFSDKEMQTARQELGKKDGQTYLVTTSRLVHKNGIDVVIRALPLLPDNIFFVIYGSGPKKDELKKLSSELGVSGRVLFKGHADNKLLPLYMKACDIFVRPSRSEGMGISFVEAMAAGLPVIATQEGGISDFLFDETINPDKKTTGWAVRTEHHDDVARAVSAILSDEHKTKTVTENAKRTVMETYNWDVVAKSMEQSVFSNLIT